MAAPMEVEPRATFVTSLNRLQPPFAAPQPLAPSFLHAPLQRLTLLEATKKSDSRTFSSWTPPLANALVQLSKAATSQQDLPLTWPQNLDELKMLEDKLQETFFAGVRTERMGDEERKVFLDVLLLSDEGKRLMMQYAQPGQHGWDEAICRSIAPDREAWDLWSSLKMPFIDFVQNTLLSPDSLSAGLLDHSCFHDGHDKAAHDPVLALGIEQTMEVFDFLSRHINNDYVRLVLVGGHAQGRSTNSDIDILAVWTEDRPSAKEERLAHATELLARFVKLEVVSSQTTRSYIFDEQDVGVNPSASKPTSGCCVLRLSYEPPSKPIRCWIDVPCVYADSAAAAEFYWSSSPAVVISAQHALFKQQNIILVSGGLFKVSEDPPHSVKFRSTRPEQFAPTTGIPALPAPFRQGAHPRHPRIALSGSDISRDNYSGTGWITQPVGGAPAFPISDDRPRIRLPINPAPPPPPPQEGGVMPDEDDDMDNSGSRGEGDGEEEGSHAAKKAKLDPSKPAKKPAAPRGPKGKGRSKEKARQREPVAFSHEETAKGRSTVLEAADFGVAAKEAFEADAGVESGSNATAANTIDPALAPLILLPTETPVDTSAKSPGNPHLPPLITPVPQVVERSVDAAVGAPPAPPVHPFLTTTLRDPAQLPVNPPAHTSVRPPLQLAVNLADEMAALRISAGGEDVADAEPDEQGNPARTGEVDEVGAAAGSGGEAKPEKTREALGFGATRSRSRVVSSPAKLAVKMGSWTREQGRGAARGVRDYFQGREGDSARGREGGGGKEATSNPSTSNPSPDVLATPTSTSNAQVPRGPLRRAWSRIVLRKHE